MTKRIVLSLLLISSAVIAGNAQKIAVAKGQKIEAVTTTKMNMELMGQNMENEMVATSLVETKDVNADGYLFTNNIKRMTIKGNAMGQEMNFDSDKKEDMDGPIGQGVKDKIGNPQEIAVDKKGKITSSSFGEDKAAGGGFSDMMSMGDFTKGQPFTYLIQLPANAVKPGDTWTDSSGTVATMKTIITYTLKGVTADGAQVSYTGTFAKNGNIEQNGMEIQMDMTGTLTGESVYDATSGLLKNATSSSDIKGTMGIMGQNVPLSGKVTGNIVAKKI